MTDSRIILENELSNLGLDKRTTTLISLDANTQKEFLNYLKSEPKPIEKIALGFCRKKDILNVTSSNKFYFHAIEQNKKVQDFPTEILDTKELYLYQGGRGKPITFTGHSGKIEKIKLKHKSEINGKQNSKTEYYYEVLLEKTFTYNENEKVALISNILFDKNDTVNKAFFKKYLPAVTTLEKIIINKNIVTNIQAERKKTIRE